MSRIMTDKKFYKSLLALAIPVALQNLISFGVALADNLMVGALGEDHLAGAATANYLTFLITVIYFGIGSGAIVLASQYWGLGDTKSIRKIIAIAMRIAVVIGLVFVVGGLFFPEACLRIFTSDETVIAYGTGYLRILAPSYILTAITSIYLISMRSVQQVIVSSIVYSASFVINVVLNYMFIFGKFGAPEMGIEGAALATLLARISEVLIVAVYILFFEKRVGFTFRDLVKSDRQLTMDYLRHGMPVLLNELLWAVGVSLQNMIIGRMGKDIVAANSITSNINQLSTIMIFGVANAAAVLVGKAVGSGDVKQAKKCANTFQVLGCVLGVISAGFIFAIRNVVVDFFNVSPETKQIAVGMMGALALILFFLSISAINIVGTLRGGGDVKFGMYADLILVWFVSVPLGFLGGLVFGWPVPVVYFCLKIDEMIKAFLCFWRIHTGKWIRNVTRENPENNGELQTEG